MRHAGLSAQDDVVSDPGPTAGWQADQCEELRVTRVRGVPLAEDGRYLGTAQNWGVHATTDVNYSRVVGRRVSRGQLTASVLLW